MLLFIECLKPENLLPWLEKLVAQLGAAHIWYGDVNKEKGVAEVMLDPRASKYAIQAIECGGFKILVPTP